MRTQEGTFTTIHSFFAWDHQRLDGLFADVVDLVEHGDLKRARRALEHYERGMRRHFRLEEEVLFLLYAFERTGAARSPKEELRAEHAQILVYLDEMSEGLAAGDAIAFHAAHARLAAILPAHHKKEEEALYPLIDALLGAEEAERTVARLRAE